MTPTGTQKSSTHPTFLTTSDISMVVGPPMQGRRDWEEEYHGSNLLETIEASSFFGFLSASGALYSRVCSMPLPLSFSIVASRIPYPANASCALHGLHSTSQRWCSNLYFPLHRSFPLKWPVAYSAGSCELLL